MNFPAPRPVFTARRRTLLATALGAGLLASGCASMRPPGSVTPVSPFDLQRYQGLWYELARLDHGFERGMTDVTAEYTPQADGSVKVVNRGFSVPRGQWQRAVGKALFTGKPEDRKSTRLNSSHLVISYAVFCLKKKK